MLQQDVLPVEFLDRENLVYVVRNFLSPQECDQFIQQSETMGYQAAPITTADGPLMAPDVRNNTRVMIDDAVLAERMWQRLEPYVPEGLLEWDVVGVNERFRFYRYDRQQRFARHYDGSYARSHRERSLITFMIYLNEGFEGGHTSFYTDLGELRFRVRPERGAALLFLHCQLHEGAPVQQGRKYVIRTDVMYRQRDV
ncbi:MAG: prolyl hydroxylase family protein [Candidatus Xenobia bacterium]